MTPSIFLTLAYPGRSLSRTFLLLKSLREFGGGWANSPCWVLYPRDSGSLAAQDLALVEQLGGEAHPFEIEPGILDFPLGGKVQAAAAGERALEGQAEQLVWLDADTLVLSALEEFTLADDKALAFSPVHHKLLGTNWGAPLDAFWELVYRRCGADPEEDFSMTTHVGERIRPYFNAGCYAVRPERGILREWEQVFLGCYQDPELQAYYQREGLYAVFAHQAVFSGVILARLGEQELQPLSAAVNYPLHLQADIPRQLRPDRLDDLVTARYENLLEEDGWQEGLPLSSQLENWIESQRAVFFQAGGRA